MSLNELKAAIALVKRLITIYGDVKLSQVVTWLEVKENAERLRLEGHGVEEE